MKKGARVSQSQDIFAKEAHHVLEIGADAAKKAADVSGRVVKKTVDASGRAIKNIERVGENAVTEIKQVGKKVGEGAHIVGENIEVAADFAIHHQGHKSWVYYCRPKILLILLGFALLITGLGLGVASIVLRQWTNRFKNHVESTCTTIGERYVPNCHDQDATSNQGLNLDCLIVEYSVQDPETFVVWNVTVFETVTSFFDDPHLSRIGLVNVPCLADLYTRTATTADLEGARKKTTTMGAAAFMIVLLIVGAGSFREWKGFFGIK